MSDLITVDFVDLELEAPDRASGTRDLAQRIGTLVRGALQYQGRLYLELRAEALGQTCMLPTPPPRSRR